MRFLSRAARIEAIRQRAVRSGELIDVTKLAAEERIPYKVYLSNRLWTSLVKPYPFAQPQDCVSLTALLCLLQIRLYAPESVDAHQLVLPSPHVPEWFRGPCYLKILINRPNDAIPSVVVHPHGEPFHVRSRPREDSLPASLMARLAVTLRHLALDARNAERSLIEAMEATVVKLTRPNPFCSEILHQVASISPAASRRFPPDAYRSLLLTNLDEQLAILAACVESKDVEHVDSLRRYYRAIVSPLAELTELAEALLRLAAQVPEHHGPIQLQSFRPLLHLYVDVHARLQRQETAMPPQAVAAIQVEMSLLAKMLPHGEAESLAKCEDELKRLLHSRPDQSALGLPLGKHHVILWH